MKLSKEDYVARISVASPLQLLIINYEIAIDFIDEAASKFNVDESLYELNIKNAQSAIIELISALDMNYELSKTLFQIYTFANKLLMTSLFSKSPEQLDVVKKMLSDLLLSWIEIQQTEESDPSLMQNSQKIYAGLTYKHGKLEEFIDEDTSKGYSV